MLILGLDPGIGITGYSFVEYNKTGYKLYKSGSIQTNKNAPHPKRLLELKNDTKRKFLKYINDNYKEYYLEYAKIYLLNDNTYFTNLKIEIENYCKSNNIKYSI